jgi:hypothetical protein
MTAVFSRDGVSRGSSRGERDRGGARRSLMSCRRELPYESILQLHLRICGLARQTTPWQPALSKSDRHIGRARTAEIENFASLTDSLAVFASHVERLLDGPPMPSAAASVGRADGQLGGTLDPALVRYSLLRGINRTGSGHRLRVVG